MNKIWVGCFLTSLYLPSVMAQAPLSLEERLAQMEQRLKATEARAASAEAEIKTLKGQQQAATVARAAPASPRLQLNDNGELKFYGDVEFNLDGASRTGSLTSVKTSANKSWRPAIKSAGILTVVFCWVSMADGMAPTGNMPDSACSLWRIWMAK